MLSILKRLRDYMNLKISESWLYFHLYYKPTKKHKQDIEDVIRTTKRFYREAFLENRKNRSKPTE